ncbi:MAG TPA: protein-tyrosine-phosphatase [Azospirillaceae bacterium]|nr:protein-tyrosine-phosphatase [Azospirillaceae bacterium]HRQ80769.1 protein-tyrosine-phosphatase [Azospirillaceae bacterium]
MLARFVPFRVTVCGIEELSGFAADGVTHVLSILDPGHAEPESFGAYGEHQRLELRFHDVIEETAGQCAPSETDVARILAFGRDLMDEPGGVGHLLVHCHAGISRSTAALTMMLAQANPSRPAAQAMAAVADIRAKAWPNLRMIEIADEMLERRGELVAAVRRRHRAYGEAHPEILDYMFANGRAREVYW